MPVYENDALELFHQGEGNPPKTLDHPRREFLIKRLAQQMLHALDYLHHYGDRGIIHRDVKPNNILFRDDNFYLGDFGLSKTVDQSMTLVGTEWYMAPEVYQRNTQTTKIDIYGLGATIAECSGKLPNPAERSHNLAWHDYLAWYNVLWNSLDSPLLAWDPNERPTARQCLDQDFPSAIEPSSWLSVQLNYQSSKMPEVLSPVDVSMRLQTPSAELRASKVSLMEWSLTGQPKNNPAERPSMETRPNKCRTPPTKPRPAKHKRLMRNIHATGNAIQAARLVVRSTSKPPRTEQTRRRKRRSKNPLGQAEHSPLRRRMTAPTATNECGTEKKKWTSRRSKPSLETDALFGGFDAQLPPGVSSMK
jgi:serine/threonine protein kinase